MTIRPRFTPEVQVAGSTHPWALRDIFGSPYYCTAEVWRDVMTGSRLAAPWNSHDLVPVARLGAGNILRFEKRVYAQTAADELNTRCLGFVEPVADASSDEESAQRTTEGSQG